MQFFIPAADNQEEAERVYKAVAEHNNAPVTGRRIFAMYWSHAGQSMSCQVGGPLPDYYKTGGEPVIAILDCGSLYIICTENRGALTGEGVFVGKDSTSAVKYFD